MKGKRDAEKENFDIRLASQTNYEMTAHILLTGNETCPRVPRSLIHFLIHVHPVKSDFAPIVVGARIIKSTGLVETLKGERSLSALRPKIGDGDRQNCNRQSASQSVN